MRFKSAAIMVFLGSAMLAGCKPFNWNEKRDPAIVAVTSTAVDDSYGAGAVISIQVVFSEPVVVSGIPQLSLSTGLPAETQVVSSGASGTDTLTFVYTVAAGNNSPDLDYTSASALIVSGVTITTAKDGKIPNLTLPTPGSAGSLGANKNIALNTAPPVVASSSPADTATDIAPCTGNPCTGKFSITFNKPMNTALGQTLTMDIWNGASYATAIPHTNTTFSWSKTNFTDDTLTVHIGWLAFPEMTQIRYTLAVGGLQDLAAQPVAASVQRSFTTTIMNQSFPLTDTGQTLCYNDTTNVVCPFGGFLNQDAEYINTPGTPSFSGPTMDPIFTADYTTRDNVTGLVWKACNEGRSGGTCATGGPTTHNWYNAINQCAALNTANAGAGYAAKTNWRLPTLKELMTILNNSVSAPAITAGNFPATSSLPHKTLTSYFSTLGGNAFIVDFNGGNAGPNAVLTASNVRCVSPLPTITTPSLVDNGDGTISDIQNNLRWQKCSQGQANDAICSGAATPGVWSVGLSYCDALVLGSHGNASNWRMPSIVELGSLSMFKNYNAAIDGSKFPATPAANYHASTTYSGGATFSWYANTVDGGTANFPDNKTVAKHTRCVSTGP